MIRNSLRNKKNARRGAAIVEMAIVGPAFLFVLFTVMEFGHYYMTVNLLNGAADQAARLGVTDGVTSAQVMAKAMEVASSGMPNSDVTVSVKNGDVFDDQPDMPTDPSDPNSGMGPFNPENISYPDLSDLEVNTAEARQLFIVRLEVDYEDVGIIGPYFLKGLKLVGLAAMRHE